nr:unnamed protein product [Digitaria exilis]
MVPGLLLSAGAPKNRSFPEWVFAALAAPSRCCSSNTAAAAQRSNSTVSTPEDDGERSWQRAALAAFCLENGEPDAKAEELFWLLTGKSFPSPPRPSPSSPLRRPLFGRIPRQRLRLFLSAGTPPRLAEEPDCYRKSVPQTSRTKCKDVAIDEINRGFTKHMK